MKTAPKKRRWPYLVGIGVLTAAGVLVATRGRTENAQVDPALVTTLGRTALQIEILETGKVIPLDKVELKSKVAGQVAKVLVEEGAQVKKGQVLLVLDGTDYQREAERASAEIAAQDSYIELAGLTLVRTRAGVEGGVTASQELDKASHDVKYRAASKRLAQVALRSAQDKLRDTQIASPIDGTVILRNIEPGEVVTPGVQATFDGKPLLTVADLSKLIVKVELNQIDVARVVTGQKATVTLDALPGEKFEAHITRIAPASVKPQGKDLEVFPVELLIDTATSKMKPGMSADVRIALEAKPNVLVLPLEAVRKEQGKSVVTKVETDPQGKIKTSKVEVTLGLRNDREVEVLSGLDEGSRVLIDPASSAENETKM